MHARDLREHSVATRQGLARLGRDAVAAVYASEAKLNSWLQGHGTP